MREPTGVTHFSDDGNHWGLGVITGIEHLDAQLPDGSWLGFGTPSASSEGISAWSVVLDSGAVDSRWLEAAMFENLAALAGHSD